MPDIRILKALNMTPAQWGQIPTTGNEREILKQKAWDIINGKLPAIESEQDADKIRAAAIEQANKENVLTRSGFESAMVQQAKFFGDAVETLRNEIKTLQERVTALESPKLAPAETAATE